MRGAKDGLPFGHIILIIIHTAMRRGEVGAIKRSYITPEAITLPSELMKNGKELVLPNIINAELSAIPSVGDSDYFFRRRAGESFARGARTKSGSTSFVG
jgi:integrase